jgi:hypothetical protein
MQWRFGCLLAALAAATGHAADEQPQLVWTAQASGVVALRVHGTSVDATPANKRLFSGQRHRFLDRLPDRRQNIRIDVIEGRGTVRIVEQPAENNRFTASVSIEDPLPDRSTYLLAFYWDTGRDIRLDLPPSEIEETMWWQGGVTGEVVVSCRGNSCAAEPGAGRAVARFNFNRPLPGRAVKVELENEQPEDAVELIEQPSESNDYAARVRIRNATGCRFGLRWAVREQTDFELMLLKPGLIWSGRVDDQVRITVHRQTASTEVVSGRPVARERAQFEQSLPGTEHLRVAFRTLRGRGDVQISEEPGPSNDWTLILEINDSGRGADDYEIEVRW